MNKTVKLYHKDSYIKEFSSVVVSCERVENGYLAVLDSTAFFPEEAGQSADSGSIGGARVVAVKEKDGIIYHTVDTPIECGSEVFCRLDFDTRFEKMQCHTAEHILSGLFHREYGIDNVGFHLGEFEVTLDTSLPVTEEMAEHIESLANEVVYKGAEVTSELYDASELCGVSYRSKLEFSGEVRLVTVEDTDVCACCAPHVKNAAEIGIIKILRLERHKNGTRIYMLAGRRALRHIAAVYKNAVSISALLSSPILSIADECNRVYSERVALEQKNRAEEIRYARAVALAAAPTEGNRVLYIERVDIAALREAANLLKEKTSGTVVTVSEREGGYSYVMLGSEDISAEVKKANAALIGRGGGRGSMAQGSFASPLSEIIEYFEARKETRE